MQVGIAIEKRLSPSNARQGRNWSLYGLVVESVTGKGTTTLLASPSVVFSTQYCPTLHGTVRAMTLGPYKQHKQERTKILRIKSQQKSVLRRRKQLVKIDKSYW